MYKNRKKRTIIIGSLLAILICMTIGYAAFSTQLEIAGSSTVTSNWDIQITGITPGTPTGTGENAVAPSYTATTATMEANLYAPGDAMTYEITIENKGTIDAVLDSITKSDSNNPAIIFETSGVNEGDPLLAGDKTTMTVKISYANVTSQPENLTGELSLTLNYVQKPSGGVTPPEPSGELATDKITELVSTNTNELYTDEHGDIRYYGATPNNYVTFNNELWRIIGVIDGKIKIIRNASLGNMQWNSSSSNNWNNASLKTYLNGEYYNSIEATSKGMISEETYYLGGATSSNDTTLTASGYYNAERDSLQVYSGNPASTTQYIGLMYPSDYGYAAGERCLSTALYDYDSSCKNSDYLFSGGDEWLQAPSASNSINAAVLLTTGRVYGYGYYAEYGSSAVRPVLYLNSNVKITGGDGSQGNAFKLG